MKRVEEDLGRLRKIDNFNGGEFGVSFVQRRLNLGWARARMLIDHAIAEGVLVEGSNEYSYEFIEGQRDV